MCLFNVLNPVITEGRVHKSLKLSLPFPGGKVNVPEVMLLKVKGNKWRLVHYN